MKTSPLQLSWVSYPEASYETLTDFDGDELAPIEVEVDAEVRYALDGRHTAIVHVASKDGVPAPYKVAVSVVAGFSFDLDIAREAYKPKATPGLPPIIAVNVARVLYSSARELLATFTARAPYRSVMLGSILLEPKDVTIRSPGASPAEILKSVFQATDAELEALGEKIKKRPKKARAARAES